MGSTITGWGSALPDKVLTNADFEAHLDTTDQWIVERTGIRERHIGGSTRGLAIEAGQAALARAGLAGADIELVVVATTTPDQTLPAASATVHEALGCRGGAFDLNAACAGFTYSLVLADSMITVGRAPRPRHRVRHAVAFDGLRGPGDGDPLRRRRRRRRPRGGRP